MAPIAIELTAASVVYLRLLLKKKGGGNFGLLIAYSCLKLLAIASIFTSSLNLFGLPNLPFLGALLLNEIVILVYIVREQHFLQNIQLRETYSRNLIILRVLSEVLFIIILFFVSIFSSIVDCNCETEEWELWNVMYKTCKESESAKNFGELVSSQIRALSFAITAVAGTVSVGGLKIIFQGIPVLENGDDENKNAFFTTLTEEPKWKKIVRNLYAWLSLVTILLFLISYFVPGVRKCAERNNFSLVSSDEFKVYYHLGPESSSLLNAMLAISQMFVFDMLIRATSANVQSKQQAPTYSS